MERDQLQPMPMFRHGLPVSAALSLCCDKLDPGRSILWVNRLKAGLSVKRIAMRRRNVPRLVPSKRGQPLTRQIISPLAGCAGRRSRGLWR